MRGFPRGLPSGWFQIAWSAELAPGEVRPVRSFGQDLVLYRSAAGDLRLLEGICVHMGAHLGHGGTVEGDCVRCPFHGWLYDATGTNVEIPYADGPSAAGALQQWEVRDLNGLVLAWFGASDEGPSWDPPMADVPESRDVGYHESFPHATAMRTLPVHPQFLAENVVDVAHNVYVHGWQRWPELVDHRSEGPVFTSEVDGYIESRSGRRSHAHAVAELFGLGLTLTHLTLDPGDGSEPRREVSLVSVSPVDNERSDIRVTLWPQRHGEERVDEGMTGAMIRGAFREVFENDGRIWENLSYRVTPKLAAIEARPAHNVRKWARQFYDDHGSG